MEKIQLTPEEIQALESEINNADDLEIHEYRAEKYVDTVNIESKKLKKKLKITYKYQGSGTNKKLINIEKEPE